MLLRRCEVLCNVVCIVPYRIERKVACSFCSEVAAKSRFVIGPDSTDR